MINKFYWLYCRVVLVLHLLFPFFPLLCPPFSFPGREIAQETVCPALDWELPILTRTSLGVAVPDAVALLGGRNLCSGHQAVTKVATCRCQPLRKLGWTLFFPPMLRVCDTHTHVPAPAEEHVLLKTGHGLQSVCSPAQCALTQSPPCYSSFVVS